ncbi:7,8-didemethyl-8-hydroxy-5-deazariboflavin synthase subunit CofG [Haloferax volcanii]|uniref:7,8-didemethyl-8-hydroxy-5-deazariboflavin synthase n=3 Tax=Haloferax volcanii TaxID=2246 RepID=A0A384LLP2_HALVD|nr:7,8-didemethyl-8-hydroxy-5-deazariboflavin synthase subunit CofG [Haloferax volcanii]ADE05050.1 7,8-didemethyl-8-hydroxy-5-deazariboflavin synthase [Haloferax volcanii DS2]ELY33430.1 FO synthase subunit 1 [Haloferax volcanii DS2]MBS8119176.1 7,8-didemethyl-8-hydroxy-5-deazariboflavin synthase subunit CofG [Haloferax volcanii]MBS8124189.1 7,8-didemethyl-8-hydroxy-5-deazariboflavin synthase subunit CofG [Haloferax volcanii]MBS8128058.1 7,8-didemethyl-8-hydroxy-5-deazariboflavin synthase subun
MFTGADEYGVDLTIDDADVERLLAVTPDDADAPASLSFSRNVFVPLTTACRYTCTYCTYYDVPGEATLMSLDEVREVVRTGADAGCTEALFTFGDAPDERYTEIHRQLDEWGYDDILDYLAAACEVALDEGLLPHSNPGDLTREAFADLAPLNASMGVMLETTADVAAHSGSRRKTPGQRLNTIRAAGEVGVPFTTGILVGIGETWRDRAESLLAIRALHERYGHVQEVIVQNVVPNERSDYERPSLDTMRRVVAMARVALPEEVSVQVPPNLSAAADLVACGVDDLGGVSPVTDDYVNPDYEWPALRELADIADEAGVPLRERLPVYERFLPNGALGPADDPGESGGAPAAAPDREWLRGPITDRLAADDVHGRRFRNVARGDGPLSIPR